MRSFKINSLIGLSGGLLYQENIWHAHQNMAFTATKYDWAPWLHFTETQTEQARADVFISTVSLKINVACSARANRLKRLLEIQIFQKMTDAS